MRFSWDFLEAGKASCVNEKGAANGNLLPTKIVLSEGVQRMMVVNVLSLRHLVNLEILTKSNGAIFLFSTKHTLQALLERVYF